MERPGVDGGVTGAIVTPQLLPVVVPAALFRESTTFAVKETVRPSSACR
jgi:hypothetical protein